LHDALPILCWQPLVGLQVSVVHVLPSSQLSGVPGLHSPDMQVSAPLHTLPSEHELPFDLLLWWHVPLLHVSVVQGLWSSHAGSLSLVHSEPASLNDVCACELAPVAVSRNAT